MIHHNPFLENEHVGVDEETLYLEKEPIHAIVCVEKEKDEDYVHEYGYWDEDEESEDESEDEEEYEVQSDEELVGHEADHIPNAEYDKEDPPMAVGSTYPRMKEFKLALSQHAIKHEFEYNTEKSAPYRFRAYCSRRDEDNCPWKLHTYTTEDKCTVMVIPYYFCIVICA